MNFFEETANPTSIQTKLLDLEVALDKIIADDELLSGTSDALVVFTAIIQSIWEEENDHAKAVPQRVYSRLQARTDDLAAEGPDF